jgi:hypothetical protein
MANFKNKKPRHQRNNHSGCCHLHKCNFNKDSWAYRTYQDKSAELRLREGVAEYEESQDGDAKNP